MPRATTKVAPEPARSRFRVQAASPSSRYQPASNRPPPSTKINFPPSTRPRIQHPRNALEAALLKLPPSVIIPDTYFPTDAEIDEESLALGYTRDQLVEGRKAFHERWDTMFANAGRNTVDMLGFKPQPGEEVQLVAIPGTRYSVRFWDGGLYNQGQCCLDFFDPTAKQAVNSPRGWKLYPAPRPGVFPLNDSHSALVSWEESWGIQTENIPAGEERFSIFQGSWCALARPGEEPFWFAVPLRHPPNFPQPTTLRM
ncbi:hypothetical protein GYMLUDRAFT_73815 [Collybiopsis luxurians FD-317 M1]|uniref:Uncharacterized protein n=1 Tax=Collybiopsis luxurians FD-317 M1 TaxID=944289 RepID=A0A0D0CNM2_9AGAR|nr:hypothetical protein GYMLUDRAFT_73815 [Collybiopsis luxurians FD-317 M1]